MSEHPIKKLSSSFTVKIFLFQKTIKIFANFTKILCYLHFFLFPKKRFKIPRLAPALIKVRAKKEIIPRIVWQTNFTEFVSLPVYINYLVNRLLAYDYDFRFLVTEDRESFISENFSREVLNSYRKLQIGASQADFWRLLTLYKNGGIYLDIDAHFVCPPNWIIAENTNHLFIKIKNDRYSNYFIASSPRSKLISALIEQIKLNIQSSEANSVYRITGPGVFNSVLALEACESVYYNKIANQGNFTNEFFQYLDKPAGKWTKQQKSLSVVRKD